MTADRSLAIDPVPTEEEAAAISAALLAVWTRPTVDDQPIPTSNRWRFSGRWWTQPGWRR